MDELRFRDIFLKVTDSKSPWFWANGQCYIYAMVFHQLVGGRLVSYLTHNNTQGHAFIEKNGKFFDSEYPDGVENWKHLKPYLKRASDKKITKHKNLSTFEEIWLTPEDVFLVNDICEKIRNTNEI